MRLVVGARAPRVLWFRALKSCPPVFAPMQCAWICPHLVCRRQWPGRGSSVAPSLGEPAVSGLVKDRPWCHQFVPTAGLRKHRRDLALWSGPTPRWLVRVRSPLRLACAPPHRAAEAAVRQAAARVGGSCQRDRERRLACCVRPSSSCPRHCTRSCVACMRVCARHASFHGWPVGLAGEFSPPFNCTCPFVFGWQLLVYA